MKKLFTLSFLLMALTAGAQNKPKESAIVIGTTSFTPAVSDFVYRAYLTTKPGQVALVAGKANVKVYYTILSPDNKVVATDVFRENKAGAFKLINLGGNHITFSSTPLIAAR